MEKNKIGKFKVLIDLSSVIKINKKNLNINPNFIKLSHFIKLLGAKEINNITLKIIMIQIYKIILRK